MPSTSFPDSNSNVGHQKPGDMVVRNNRLGVATKGLRSSRGCKLKWVHFHFSPTQGWPHTSVLRGNPPSGQGSSDNPDHSLLRPRVRMKSVKVKVLVTQSCPTLCDPMDYSPPGSSVHGILQARILGWVPFPPPGDLPNPMIQVRSPALQADSSLSHWGSLILIQVVNFFQSKVGKCSGIIR